MANLARYRRFDISYLIIYVIDFITAVIVILIGLRILLKLFGANAANDIVAWIYEVSGQLIAPFTGIFPIETVDGRFVIEFSAIFALIVYLVVSYLITELISYVAYSSPRYRR